MVVGLLGPVVSLAVVLALAILGAVALAVLEMVALISVSNALPLLSRSPGV